MKTIQRQVKSIQQLEKERYKTASNKLMHTTLVNFLLPHALRIGCTEVFTPFKSV